MVLFSITLLGLISPVNILKSGMMYYILHFDLDLAYEQRFEYKADPFSSFSLEVLEEAARNGLSNYTKCG